MHSRAGRLVLLIVFFFLLAGFEIKKMILVLFVLYDPRII